jgi:hypothetical protein
MEIDISALDRPTILLGVFLLIISYHVISSIFAWRRLRGFPGPFFASFSYLWVMRASQTGHIDRILMAEANKHGTTTIRVAPNELLTGDPELIRRITAARSRYRRSDWYRLHRL